MHPDEMPVVPVDDRFAGEPNLSLEQAQAVVATKPYPKVTKESIEAKIQFVEYTFPSIHNPTLMVCVITMRNGFSVLGKAAPASKGNFDADVGKRYAYEDAFKQLWPLEGYLLREDLHRYEQVPQPGNIDQG